MSENKKNNKDVLDEKLRQIVLSGLAFHRFNKTTEQKLELSLVQYHVLKAVLESPGISAQTLAKNTGAHPSSLTQTMKILTRKGFLYIDEHPRDSRMKIILATKSGKNALDHFNDQIPAYLEEFILIDPLMRTNTDARRG
jgi:DNA-binding MarR family transcriptional regulator